MKNTPDFELETSHKEELRRNAALDPPAWLDRRILRRIRRQPLLRPFLAGGVAVAGLIAMVTWLAAVYSESGSSVQPIPAAVITILAYLALCCVATLPLMMLPGRFGLPATLAKEAT